MKKLILFFALLIPTTLFGQRIEKNEYDRFEKYWIVKTKMEKIASNDGDKIEICMRRSGESWQMLAFLHTTYSEKYDDGNGLSLLLDNDDVIRLVSVYTGVGYHFSTVYHLTKEDVEKLQNHNIIAIRSRYIDGHKDYDVPENKQELIMNMINAIENEFYQKTLLQNK